MKSRSDKRTHPLAGAELQEVIGIVGRGKDLVLIGAPQLDGHGEAGEPHPVKGKAQRGRGHPSALIRLSPCQDQAGLSGYGWLASKRPSNHAG